MSGFFEEFMGSYNPFDSAGYDEQVIMRNSLFAVVPKIAKTSLLKCNVFVLKCFILKRKIKNRLPQFSIFRSPLCADI